MIEKMMLKANNKKNALLQLKTSKILINDFLLGAVKNSHVTIDSLCMQ